MMAHCNGSSCLQNSKSLGYTCLKTTVLGQAAGLVLVGSVRFWNLFDICVGLYHWFGSDTDRANPDCAGLRFWYRNLENYSILKTKTTLFFALRMRFDERKGYETQ